MRQVAGIPYWSSLHGVEAWGLENKSRCHGIAAADLLLPVSRYTRDRVEEEQNLPVNRFRVLPNTFDPEEFRIGPKSEYLFERYGLSPNQPVILTIGRMNRDEGYKGQDRVLRVLLDVAKQVRSAEFGSQNANLTEDSAANGDLRYIIVGDGNDRPRLEQLAKDLGVRDQVVFTGRVPAHELNDHYNLCDVFAMPSTGEGFGIVFLEALACGKPVIAGNKDASRDTLLDGELGVLIDPDEPAALRDAIATILAEVKIRKAKVENIGPTSDLRSPPSGLRIPEIIFQPEQLRAKVIEHFGYEKFKETLAGYLQEFFDLK